MHDIAEEETRKHRQLPLQDEDQVIGEVVPATSSPEKPSISKKPPPPAAAAKDAAKSETESEDDDPGLPARISAAAKGKQRARTPAEESDDEKAAEEYSNEEGPSDDDGPSNDEDDGEEGEDQAIQGGEEDEEEDFANNGFDNDDDDNEDEYVDPNPAQSGESEAELPDPTSDDEPLLKKGRKKSTAKAKAGASPAAAKESRKRPKRKSKAQRAKEEEDEEEDEQPPLLTEAELSAILEFQLKEQKKNKKKSLVLGPEEGQAIDLNELDGTPENDDKIDEALNRIFELCGNEASIKLFKHADYIKSYNTSKCETWIKTNKKSISPVVTKWQRAIREAGTSCGRTHRIPKCSY